MKKNPRKEREKAHARRDILEAAAAAFARRGFHGTTIEDVAREAGYSPSSLYTYFKGKDDLYQSLLQEVAAQFEALKEEPILSPLGFEARLEWLLRRQFELVEKHRDFFIVFADQQGGAKSAMNKVISDMARDNYLGWISFTSELLGKGMQEGAVRQGDPRDLAYFLIGTVNAAVFRWVAGDLPTPLQDHVTVLLELLLTGFRPGNPGPGNPGDDR